jgi:DNA-binding SARP family transcriptional activator/tetratricopeptide (TPR) repeat protein
VRATGAAAVDGIRVAVLGPLALAVGDRDVVVAGYRRRALLARLALARGSLVPSGRLADDLWEDDPGRRSLPTMRTYVAKLRQLLPGGEALLASGPGGYRLALPAGALDAARFERAVDAAATMPPGDVVGVLVPALAEWRGGAYEEFAHLGWARHEAMRLDELRLAGQERLFDAQMALGRHAEIVPALGALAAAHPLRERLQVEWVTALYGSGRQAEALAAQRRATAALVDGLGLDPCPELAALEQRILRQDATLAGPPGREVRAPAPPVVARLPRPLQQRRRDPPFVGRVDELARLDAALAATGGDGARLVVVRGEPGIGKTRLAAQLAEGAVRRGAAILYGYCDEGIGAPYQPFVTALRELASRAPRDMLAAWLGDDPGALAALVPDLAGHLPGREVTPGADPAGQRLRLFDAVAGWLRAVAEAGPTIVVLEDVHWATSSTMMLTRHAVRALADRPVLVLATARSTAPDANPLVTDLVADLHRDGKAEVMDLSGLDGDALGALVAAEQGGPAPPATVDRLRAATAGNPFLLTRLARYGALDGSAVPPSLRDVVLARLGRLPAPVGDAVRVGAAAGVEFDVGVVARVLDRDDDETITALDEAVAAGLLQEVDGAAGRYGFVHGLVQVAVAEGRGFTRRAATHAAVARALEARGGQPDEIAHHWRSAGPGHEQAAADWSMRAGGRALAQLAYEEAAHHLATALALGARRSPAWRSAVLLDLATARLRMGDAAEARDALLEAAALARATGDAVTLARAALESSLGGRGVSGWIADPARVDLLEEARTLLPAAQRVLRIRVAGELALARYQARDRAVRARLGREAVALAAEDGDPAALLAALPASRVVYWHPRDTPARRDHARGALEAAQVVGDPGAMVAAVDWLAADAYELGDRAGFDAAVARARALAAAADGLVPRWRARVWDAVAAATDGNLDEAERHAGAALAAWDADPAPDALVAYGAQVCMLRLLQGRAAEAAGVADAASSRIPDNAGIAAPRALVLAMAGRMDDAAGLVTRLAADGLDGLPHDSQWLLAAVVLAEAAVLVGDAEAMEACSAALAPFPDRLVALAGPGLVWGSVAHQLGSLALALGRPAEAVTHLERACAVERSFGALPWLARSESRLAEARAQCTEKAYSRLLGVPNPKFE